MDKGSMPTLNFSSESDGYKDAKKVYESIWKERRGDIISALESTSGLKFSTESIDVIIHEAPSHSGNGKDEPMKLRASYSENTKLATLVHELGHILLIDNDITAKAVEDIHDILFLFLYDAWVELEDAEFADNQVKIEKKRGQRYVESWQKALTLSKQQRIERLKQTS